MRFVLVGAGGHASDTLEVALRAGWQAAAALDERGDGERVAARGVPVVQSVGELPDEPWLAAIGYPEPRAALVERLRGPATPPLVDPSAVVSPTAELGEGSTVFWLAGVSPNVRLGAHSFVSYGATVGHDSVVGAVVSIMPGARVSGGVSIGDGVLVGTGAVVLEGRRIGAGARVGAGAVVTGDVPPGATVVGNPAG